MKLLIRLSTDCVKTPVSASSNAAKKESNMFVLLMKSWSAARPTALREISNDAYGIPRTDRALCAACVLRRMKEAAPAPSLAQAPQSEQVHYAPVMLPRMSVSEQPPICSMHMPLIRKTNLLLIVFIKILPVRVSRNVPTWCVRQQVRRICVTHATNDCASRHRDNATRRRRVRTKI